MFNNFTKLTKINFNDMVDTSKVTSMYGMFQNCSALTSLDLSSFDTSKVTYMHTMFRDCSSLISINLSSFDTSNVTNMSCMFENNSALTTLDLSSFDTSKVIDMYNLFYNCKSLISLDLSSFDTSNAISMYSMFYGTYLHQAIARTQSDADKYNATSNTTFKFYPGKVSVMNSRKNDYVGEYYAYKSTITTIDYVSSIDISNAHEYWDISNVLDGSIIAWINNGDLNHLYIGTNNNKIKISSGNNMFFSFTALTTINNMSMLDTSDVTNIASMFEMCNALTSLDLSSFYTSKVTNMYGMFSYCKALTTLDLGNFVNTNTTTNMGYMFDNCTALKTIDLSGLTISDTTTNVDGMFTVFTLNEQGSYAYDSTSATNLNALSHSNAFRVKS